MMSKFVWFMFTIAICLGNLATCWGQSDTTANVSFFISSVDEVIDITTDIRTSVTTASKKAEKITEAASIISVVTQKEIEAYGALSLAEVLDRITSTYVVSTYAYPNNMVSIRGDNTEQYNNRVLILLDGRPVRESMFLGENRAIYTMIPLQIIERIELLRGPGSTLYGTSAFTGAINIITKKGKKARKFLQSILYGSFNRFQANIAGGVGVKDGTLSWGLNYVTDKGWDFSAVDENGTQRTIQMLQDGIGAQLKFDYKNFTFQAYYGQSLEGTIGNSPKFGSGSSRPYDDYRSYSSRLFADAGYDLKIGENITNQTHLTYNGYDFRFFYLEANDISRRASSNDVLIENTTFLTLGRQLDFILGGVANYRQGEGTEPTRNTDGSSYDIFGNTSPNPTPFAFVPNSNEVFWGAYAQVNYTPWKHLKIVAGGQLNKAPDIPVDFSPRISLISNITADFGLKFLYGVAFRSPSISERFRVSSSAHGNIALAPEKINTMEAQIFYDKPKVAQVSLTWFNNHGDGVITRSHLEDSVLIINGQPIIQYINEGEINTTGLELDGKFPVHKNITLQVSGSYYWHPEATVHHEHGAISTGMPDLMAKLGISYRLPKYFSLGVFHSYFGKGGDIEAENSVNPPANDFHFLTANLRINLATLFRFKGSYNMFLELYAKNILDAKVYYPEYIRRHINSIPGRAGQAFYGTLKFSF